MAIAYPASTGEQWIISVPDKPFSDSQLEELAEKREGEAPPISWTGRAQSVKPRLQNAKRLELHERL